MWGLSLGRIHQPLVTMTVSEEVNLGIEVRGERETFTRVCTV